MYFSPSHYKSRDTHLSKAFSLIYSKHLSVSASSKIEAVNDRYILITLNDAKQDNATFIARGIAQRKIDRFMDNLVLTLSLPIQNYRNERGENTIICEPKDFLSALFVMLEDLEDEMGVDEPVREALEGEARCVEHLTNVASQTSRMAAPRPL